MKTQLYRHKISTLTQPPNNEPVRFQTDTQKRTAEVLKRTSLSTSASNVFDDPSARSFSPLSFESYEPAPFSELSNSTEEGVPVEATRWGNVKHTMRFVLIAALVSIAVCIVFSAFIASYYISIPLAIIAIALFVHKSAEEKEAAYLAGPPAINPMPETPGTSTSQNFSSNGEARERLARIRRGEETTRSHQIVADIQKSHYLK